MSLIEVGNMEFVLGFVAITASLFIAGCVILIARLVKNERKYRRDLQEAQNYRRDHPYADIEPLHEWYIQSTTKKSN